MAGCNCPGGTCGCLFEVGEGLLLSGIGTKADPYLIRLEAPAVNGSVLQFDDSATVEWVDTGGGSTTDPRIISANVVVPDPFPAFTTVGRPSAATVGIAAAYYDTTLDKPGWSDGAVWRDASGAAM